MKLKPIIGGIVLAMAAATTAQAHEAIYKAVLDGPSEAPPNVSPGHGTATVTIDFDLMTMRIEASFSGLIGPVTASHIHCCTAVSGTGTIGVATVTPTFTGFPAGVTAGSYDHTFDMTIASSYNAAFIAARGGTVSGALNALLLGLDGGKAYFNIHTSAFPGGEIRGF
ncbi:MAG: CHRD domain-containing protein, partial [Rhodocyclaceae bacterium]|nr:CHRD domain-containing protein [Rhodocyclaceae bacterium]